MTNKRPKMKRPAPLAELLAVVFAGQPVANRLEEAKIWQVWEEAVGRQIAERARPASLRDGVLTLTVASAPWMQQLNFLKKELIVQLNQAIGSELVRDIYLKAGSLKTKEPPNETVHRPPHQLTAAEQTAVAQQVATIQDEGLRSVIQHLWTTHLSRPEETATESIAQTTLHKQH